MSPRYYTPRQRAAISIVITGAFVVGVLVGGLLSWGSAARATARCKKIYEETIVGVLDQNERVLVASSSLAALVEKRLGRPVKKYKAVAPPGEALPTWVSAVRADGFVELEESWSVVEDSNGAVASVFDGERWWQWNAATGIWVADQ